MHPHFNHFLYHSHYKEQPFLSSNCHTYMFFINLYFSLICSFPIYNMEMLMIVCMVLTWIFIHRLNQRNKKGPKTWPLVGAAIEQFIKYDRMHDWLVQYLSESNTVVVPMPFTTYTYIADPANVEHVLKTNFANYPKVKDINIHSKLSLLLSLTLISL